MHDKRDEAAALNNAEWCAAVWRSHGLPVGQAHGLWFCDRETPRYYPNVVTVEPGANPAAQTAFIADLRTSAPDLDVSVKDSFAVLDLRDLGMEPLFDAGWLFRPAAAAEPPDRRVTWRRIMDAPGLTAWESAWRGGDQSGPRIFLPQLLHDPRTIVLAGYDKRGAITAGGVAYDAAGALGLTNLFGAERACIQAFARLAPKRDMVCYSRREEHGTMEKAGFRVLGPLRIWVRGV